MGTLWSSRSGANSLPLRPTSDFGVAIRPTRLTPEDRDLVETTVGRLGEQTLLQAAYEVGILFTSLLRTDYRSRLGIYFTPPALVDRLLDVAQEAGAEVQTCRVLDPACGGGAFLAPVLLRKLEVLRRRRARTALEAVAEQVRGFEIDPFAPWLSQAFAELALQPLVRGGDRPPLLVEVRDALAAPHPEAERFDLVIGNPPYSRVRLAEEWRQHFRRNLFGHANLYGLFTDQALRHLTSHGVVAFVTPTSFLGGEYFKNLRVLLQEEAPPTHLEFVAEREKAAFLGMLEAAGYSANNAAFLTAFQDRDAQPFRKTFGALAHQSFAWCLSEPELLIGLHRLGDGRHLREILGG